LANDGSYIEDLTVCDGSDSVIVAALSCSVASSHFTGVTFDLAWGSSIFAKVTATNYLGSSTESDAGNGALILTVPAAPDNLQNNAAVTMGDRIGLIWDAPTFVAGTPTIDYKIEYDQGFNVYVTLETGVTTTSYTATSLTPGVIYAFMVYARNTEGYSVASSEASILAAQEPNMPSAPTTTINGDNVDIAWSEPFAEGSAITEYTIYIR
jgi:hypothetical protein